MSTPRAELDHGVQPETPQGEILKKLAVIAKLDGINISPEQLVKTVFSPRTLISNEATRDETTPAQQRALSTILIVPADEKLVTDAENMLCYADISGNNCRIDFPEGFAQPNRTTIQLSAMDEYGDYLFAYLGSSRNGEYDSSENGRVGLGRTTNKVDNIIVITARQIGNETILKPHQLTLKGTFDEIVNPETRKLGERKDDKKATEPVWDSIIAGLKASGFNTENLNPQFTGICWREVDGVRFPIVITYSPGAFSSDWFSADVSVEISRSHPDRGEQTRVSLDSMIPAKKPNDDPYSTDQRPVYSFRPYAFFDPLKPMGGKLITTRYERPRGKPNTYFYIQELTLGPNDDGSWNGMLIYVDNQEYLTNFYICSSPLPANMNKHFDIEHSGNYSVTPIVKADNRQPSPTVDIDSPEGDIFPAKVRAPVYQEIPLEKETREQREEFQRQYKAEQQRRRQAIQPILENPNSIVDTERSDKGRLVGKRYGLEGMRFKKWELNPTETDLESCVSKHGESILNIVTTPAQSGVKIEIKVNGATKRVFQVNKGEQPSPEIEAVLYLLATNSGMTTSTQNNQRRRADGDPYAYKDNLRLREEQETRTRLRSSQLEPPTPSRSPIYRREESHGGTQGKRPVSREGGKNVQDEKDTYWNQKKQRTTAKKVEAKKKAKGDKKKKK